MHNVAASFQQGVGDAWADLGDFVPRLLLALGVFFVGWILAVVLKKVVDLVMERSASQRGRGGAVATVAVRARRSIPRLVHLAVMLVTLWTAIEVIDPGSGESPAADFVDALRGLFLVLGLAALLTVCAVVVVGVGGGLVRPMEERWEAWLQRMGPAPFPDSQQQEPERQQVGQQQSEQRRSEPPPEPGRADEPAEDAPVAGKDAGEGPPTARMPAVPEHEPDGAEERPRQGATSEETQVLPTTGRRPQP